MRGRKKKHYNAIGRNTEQQRKLANAKCSRSGLALLFVLFCLFLSLLFRPHLLESMARFDAFVRALPLRCNNPCCYGAKVNTKTARIASVAAVLAGRGERIRTNSSQQAVVVVRGTKLPFFFVNASLNTDDPSRHRTRIYTRR